MSMAAGRVDQLTTLMMRNLPPGFTKEALLMEIDSLGLRPGVTFAHVCTDFKTKECSGVAWVDFFSPAMAQLAKERWQGRREIAGISCSRGRKNTQINVAFAKKQGFDACVTENHRKHIKDEHLKAWVHPMLELRRDALELAKDTKTAMPSLASLPWPVLPVASVPGVPKSDEPAYIPLPVGHLGVSLEAPLDAAASAAPRLSAACRPPPGLEQFGPTLDG